MTTTPESDIAKLTQIDKKNLLEAALNSDTFKQLSQSFSQNTQASDKTIISEYEALFNDEDIDDSEEIFKNALKIADEKLKHEEEFKKKNPHLKHFDFLFKEPKKPIKPRKRKAKVLEDTIDAMNNFKKQLIESKNMSNDITMSAIHSKQNDISTLNTKESSRKQLETTNLEHYSTYFTNKSFEQNNNFTLDTKIIHSIDKKTNSTIDTKTTAVLKQTSTISSWNAKQVSYKKNMKTNCTGTLNLRELVKSSIIDSMKDVSNNSNASDSMVVYPKWNHTVSYTPIFSKSTNPNWKFKNKIFVKSSDPSDINLKSFDNLYTPVYTKKWMEGVDDKNLATFSSCKSIKSNVATCSDSICNQNELQTSLNSPKIASEITKRSTVVHFKQSSPEHIPCSYSSDDTSDQSNSLLEEEIRNNTENYKYYDILPENYKFTHNNSSEPDEYYPEIYKDHSPVLEQVENYQSHYKKSCNDGYKEYCEEHHFNSIKSNIYNKRIQNISGTSKPPFFVEDFIKKLNHNISNNYNMEFKCSMKLKYFS